MNSKYFVPIMSATNLQVDAPLCVRFQDQKVVLIKTRKGIFAYEDFCPHRGLALSEGFVKEGQLICKYHGWQFDCSNGENTLVPVKNQPILCKLKPLFAKEQYGFIWLSKDSNALLPNLSTNTPTFLLEGTIHAQAINVLENFLEGSHTHYIHDGLIRSKNKKRHRIMGHIKNYEWGFRVTYDKEAAKGWITRLLPKSYQDLYSVSTYIHPGIAVLEFYNQSNHSIAKFEATLAQDDKTTKYFARIFLNVGWLTPFIKPLANLVFQKIVNQDKIILELQEKNLKNFINSDFVSDQTDLVGKYIYAWQKQRSKELNEESSFYVYW
ncbi:MAG TPA: Rieske 2Fe-2S domain-containing protein [Saprospiraceae bacterium]|nr:Rieske 2Fe-2S domain-containing protein [Saprospiraceae bacterium]